MQENTIQLPPLNWLKTFVVAAKRLNFTMAAKDLNMT
jgi:DNA-binding transcriptional LysR family regulator